MQAAIAGILSLAGLSLPLFIKRICRGRSQIVLVFFPSTQQLDVLNQVIASHDCHQQSRRA
jgi:hypothetical protein